MGQTNENLASQIDDVTLAQVQEAVANSLKTPLTYVSRGGEVSSLPSYDNVTKLFNWSMTNVINCIYNKEWLFA